MRYKAFTLTKSMVKKLYSKRANTGYNDVIDDLDRDNTLTDAQRQIKSSILRRHGITNDYWSSFYESFSSFVYWVFCCKYCCGKKSTNKRERDFNMAQNMLI